MSSANNKEKGLVFVCIKVAVNRCNLVKVSEQGDIIVINQLITQLIIITILSTVCNYNIALAASLIRPCTKR